MDPSKIYIDHELEDAQMKGFHRSYTLFSLCGLNCGLCPMHIDKYCHSC